MVNEILESIVKAYSENIRLQFYIAGKNLVWHHCRISSGVTRRIDKYKRPIVSCAVHLELSV